MGQKGFAVDHSVNGVDKVSRLRPLEQESRRAGVQRADDVIVIFERGEDQDTDVRQSATDADQIIRRLTVYPGTPPGPCTAHHPGHRRERPTRGHHCFPWPQRANGDFNARLATLDPDVVPRADGGAALAAVSVEIRGALDVARRGSSGRPRPHHAPALVNGAAGVLTTHNGEVFTIATVIFRNRKIAEVDLVAGPKRLTRLDPTIL